MIADVTIRIQITAGHLVSARDTSRLRAACPSVLLMVTGEPGANGQIARVTVESPRDTVLVPALILHPHTAGGAVKAKPRNTWTASWVIVRVSIAQYILLYVIMLP